MDTNQDGSTFEPVYGVKLGQTWQMTSVCSMLNMQCSYMGNVVEKLGRECQYLLSLKYALIIYISLGPEVDIFRFRAPLQLSPVGNKSRGRTKRLESTKIVMLNIDTMPNDGDCTEYTASSSYC